MVTLSQDQSEVNAVRGTIPHSARVVIDTKIIKGRCILMTSQLKTEMPHLVASILVLPFLAAWPFLSALPVFSLVGRSDFDVSAVLNIVFLLTGFWAIAGGFWIMSWLTAGRLGSAKGRNRMIVIGGYAALWTVLYTAAAMWRAV